MPSVKFGSQQLRNPTPHHISMLFDFLAGACGIISGFVTTAAFISHNVSDVVSSILTALVIPMLLLSKRFFGVETPAGPIPKEDVIEMDTKKDN